MSNTTLPVSNHQRGAATLLLTMVFLFSTSIIIFYLNRSILFEQKTSANQMRSTMAMEMAEAGMEWAIGMLNTAYDINSSCDLLATTNTPFRQKYIQTKWDDATNPSTNVEPATNTYPGCKINGNSMACSCPEVPPSGNAIAIFGTDVLPGFTVTFSKVENPNNPSKYEEEAVRIAVTGCTAQADACTPNTSGISDATATITSIVKMRPLLRAAPAAPLTCGTSCAIGGSYNIVNQDLTTSGILVNAGTTITAGGKEASHFKTISGQPYQNALVGNDSSLSVLSSADPTCNNSAMFSTYFGSTIAQYAASPMTKIITGCSHADTCGNLVDTAYNDGWRSFYFPDGFARNNSSGSLGTAKDPVTLVSTSSFDVNGNIDIYGMIFSNNSNINAVGTGTANIHGAMVTCADYSNKGNGTLEYDAEVLKGVRRSTGVLVRVPGSWTDKCTIDSATFPATSPAASAPALICN